MKPINFKKTTFDSKSISFNMPYRIFYNGKWYVGSFWKITEYELGFSYFNYETDESESITIHLDDKHVTICPFNIPETYNISEGFSPEDLKHCDIQPPPTDIPKLEDELVKEDDTDVPVESVGPDIKKFYIANNVLPLKNEPLFILKDDKWVINTPIIRNYFNMKNILVRVNYGVGEYNTDAYAVFPPECVEINSNENQLCCIDRSQKCGYTLKSIYINSNSWRRLSYAHIEIVDKDWYEGEI